jgi:hypothetical protein
MRTNDLSGDISPATTADALSLNQYQVGDYLEISSDSAHEWITGLPVEVRR